MVSEQSVLASLTENEASAGYSQIRCHGMYSLHMLVASLLQCTFRDAKSNDPHRPKENKCYGFDNKTHEVLLNISEMCIQSSYIPTMNEFLEELLIYLEAVINKSRDGYFFSQTVSLSVSVVRKLDEYFQSCLLFPESAKNRCFESCDNSQKSYCQYLLGQLYHCTRSITALKIIQEKEIGLFNERLYKSPIKFELFPALQHLELDHLSVRELINLAVLRLQLISLNVKWVIIDSVSQILYIHSADAIINEYRGESQWDIEITKLGMKSGDGKPSKNLPQWLKLEALKLGSCEINNTDPSLRLLPSVKFIDFSCNKIEDVYFFQDCTKLEHLDLSSNCIRNVINIQNVLGNIRVLNLGYNKIQTTEGLNKLYSLETLNLQFNRIVDLFEVSRLISLPYLTKLKLMGNPLSKHQKYRFEVLAIFWQSSVYVTNLDDKQITLFEQRRLKKIEFHRTELKVEKYGTADTTTNSQIAIPENYLVNVQRDKGRNIYSKQVFIDNCTPDEENLLSPVGDLFSQQDSEDEDFRSVVESPNILVDGNSLSNENPDDSNENYCNDKYVSCSNLLSELSIVCGTKFDVQDTLAISNRMESDNDFINKKMLRDARIAAYTISPNRSSFEADPNIMMETSDLESTLENQAKTFNISEEHSIETDFSGAAVSESLDSPIYSIDCYSSSTRNHGNENQIPAQNVSISTLTTNHETSPTISRKEYFGSLAYKDLLVTDHLQLYFREQVFSSYLDSPFLNTVVGMNLESRRKKEKELFVELFRDTVLPCAASGVASLDRHHGFIHCANPCFIERRFILFTLSQTGDGVHFKYVLMRPSNERDIDGNPLGDRVGEVPALVVISNFRIFLISEEGLNGKTFEDAPRPLALLSVEHMNLKEIIIGFGFQKFKLCFEQLPSDAEKNMSFQMIVMTRSRARTHSAVAALEPLVSSARMIHGLPDLSITNADAATLKQMSELLRGSDMTLYSLLVQRWELRPWVAAPRTLVISQSELILCSEDHTQIVDKNKFKVIDRREISSIQNIRKGSVANQIVFEFKTGFSFSVGKTWILQCRTGNDAEIVLEKIRRLRNSRKSKTNTAVSILKDVISL